MCHENTSWQRSALVRKPRFIGGTWLTAEYQTLVLAWKCSVLFCVGKLVTLCFSLMKVLKYLTVQFLVFSGSFAVKRIETVAVHLALETERNGDR